MQLILDLSESEALLLRTLSARGSARKADDYLQQTAKSLLLASMRSEARRRRIGLDRVGAIALVEAVERKAER